MKPNSYARSEHRPNKPEGAQVQVQQQVRMLRPRLTGRHRIDMLRVSLGVRSTPPTVASPPESPEVKCQIESSFRSFSPLRLPSRAAPLHITTTSRSLQSTRLLTKKRFSPRRSTSSARVATTSR